MFLSILAFFAALISLAVDVTVMLGLDEQLQAIGRYILFGLTGLMASIFIYQMYRQLGRVCWRNALRVRRVRSKLNRFLDDHDGTTVNANVDVSEIYLIHCCKKARHLTYRVRDVKSLGRRPGGTRERIELVIDKGREDDLVADMRFAVYKKNDPSELCVVWLKNPGESQAHPPGEPYGTLGTKSTRIILPVDPAWNLDTGDLGANSFDVRLIEHATQSIIDELLSTLVYEVDRKWTLRDFRE